MTPILDIEGIGEKYAGKLKAVGVNTVEELLTQGATREGRQLLALKTEISDTLILKWVNLADLFRVKGVGEEYSELLEAAGVDSVAELAQRVPETLHAKLVETNKARKLVRSLPGVDRVAAWVNEAKNLPAVVSH
jgi:predicted flap endonuclease-1-like 5' DNA nuclease